MICMLYLFLVNCNCVYKVYKMKNRYIKFSMKKLSEKVNYCLLVLLLLSTSVFSTSLHKDTLINELSFFTENKGQIRQSNGKDADFVSFVYAKGSTSIFLLKNCGIAWQFNKRVGNELAISKQDVFKLDPDNLSNLTDSLQLQTYRMDMILEGAKLNPEIVGEVRSNDYSNYYTYNVLDVHSYSRVIYKEVYSGIDWVIYFTENGIKYDFIVKPGANVNDIKLKFIGHESLYVDDEGNLIHGNRLGTFKEEKPISYQGGMEVKTKFILKSNTLSFEIEKYDPSQSLIIDPNRIWATYYGGTSDDYGQKSSTDQSGNVYLCGQTGSFSNIASLGFQATNAGSFDAFLVKFNSSGVRQWATYYGGSGTDWVNSCSTDQLGNVYIFGLTSSTTNIASLGFQNGYGGGNDAFLVKFNSSGLRQWATYYGGSGIEFPYSCSTDPSGNIYFSGYTNSATNISSLGFQNFIGGGNDAFLVKFNSSGVRQWATYYGGSGTESGHSCSTDQSGNVYLCGYTSSATNIASLGFQNSIGGGADGFLVKFNSSGTRQWATYYGGSGADYGYSCSADQSSNIYIGGYTGSTTSIASLGFQNSFGGGTQDAFLVKFNSSGIRQWATYYGGSGTDQGRSCATDPSGNIYLCGYTGTTAISPGTVIATSGSHQSSFGGGAQDAFLVKFNSSGTRQWATYYGGSGADYGYSCSADQSSNVYLCGYTGTTAVNQGTVIASSGSHQSSFGGIWDAFLVKFGQMGSGVVSATNNSPFCQGNNLTLSAGTILGATYNWSGPNGFTSGLQNPVLVGATALATGVYIVTAITGSATYTGSTSVIVNPIPTQPIAASNSTICSGSNLSLTALPNGATSYNWTGPNGFNSNLQNPVLIGASALAAGQYSVTRTVQGCTSLKGITNVAINLIAPSTINVSSLGPFVINNVTHTVSGVYTYTLLTSNGCDSIVTINLNYAPIGIRELGLSDNGIVIYPNPSNGLFNIDLKNNLELKEIEFYDYSMKRIETMNYSQFFIDISDYSDGVYFLKIVINKRAHWVKLIKLSGE
jgi:hypothetical protein